MSDPKRDGERFRVPAELDGVRLDRALGVLVDSLSRQRLREMVEDGRVRVGGEVVTRPATSVRRGDELVVEMVLRDRSRTGSAEGAELRTLFVDEHLVVVDKPAGMVAHPSSVVRGGTLAERCDAEFGPLPDVQGEDRPGIVHRLDKDTTGVVVLARTEAAGVALVDAFRERTVEKTYLALVVGDPRFDSEWVTEPIGRLPGKGERMAVVPEGEGRAAETYYEVRERYAGFALVECRPTTGRTHQIRVHLAHAELPVLGDRVYRPARFRGRRLPPGCPRLGRQALHAHRLVLNHPATGERVTFEAPLPDDMAAVAAFLRNPE